MINGTDILNIKNELSAREAAKYHFKKGGFIEDKKKLQAMTTKELERLVHEYKGNDVSDDEKQFFELAKKMFDAVPELKFIPFWAVEIDTSVDRNLNRIYPNKTYLEITDMTMCSDGTFGLPRFAEEAFIEKYGHEVYSDWCDAFFNSYPYECDWLYTFGDKLLNDSDIYVKMISRCMEYEDKIFSYNMSEEEVAKIYV